MQVGRQGLAKLKLCIIWYGWVSFLNPTIPDDALGFVPQPNLQFEIRQTTTACSLKIHNQAGRGKYKYVPRSLAVKDGFDGGGKVEELAIVD